LRLVLEGRRKADIAKALGKSPNTVRNHIAEIFRTFYVRSRSELIALLSRRPEREQAGGLLRPPASLPARHRRDSGGVSDGRCNLGEGYSIGHPMGFGITTRNVPFHRPVRVSTK
jgi:hypothetical protein